MITKKILLPKIPDNIIQEVYNSIESGTNQAFDGDNAKYRLDFYAWIAANNAVQEWCTSNISPDIYWGIQVIDQDMPIHQDLGTESKFNYIIELGGDNVVTNYYDEEENVIESIVCSAYEWYILNVKIKHDVKNVISRRISITGRIHP